jgi:hypothetical protein
VEGASFTTDPSSVPPPTNAPEAPEAGTVRERRQEGILSPRLLERRERREDLGAWRVAWRVEEKRTRKTMESSGGVEGRN